MADTTRSKPQGARRLDKRLDKLSRKLVKTLRHQAPQLGLPMAADGYVPLAALQGHPRFQGMTEEDVRTMVAACPKQRLGLKEDADAGLLVRANQGHTIKAVDEEALLERVTDAAAIPVAVHGTTRDAWALIRASGGLRRMTRAHVHFAPGEPEEDGVISGMRKSSAVLCFLDVPRALAEGLPLFVSENGVILTPGMATVAPTAEAPPVTEAAPPPSAEASPAKRPRTEGDDAGAPLRELVPLRLLRVIDRKTREVLYDGGWELASDDAVS